MGDLRPKKPNPQSLIAGDFSNKLLVYYQLDRHPMAYVHGTLELVESLTANSITTRLLKAKHLAIFAARMVIVC